MVNYNSKNAINNYENKVKKHLIEKGVELRENYKVLDLYAKRIENLEFLVLLCECQQIEGKVLELPLSAFASSKGNFAVATLQNKDIDLYRSTFRVDNIQYKEITLKDGTKYNKKIYTFNLVNYE